MRGLLLMVAGSLLLGGCLIKKDLYEERWDELPPECGDEDYEPPASGDDPCDEEQEA